MKVLLITTTYPTPARPQQGAFNRILVEALRTRHDVRVIAPIPWTQALGSKTSDRDRDGRRDLHPLFYYPPKLQREHYHAYYWQSIYSSIKRLEEAFIPDVVMGYWLHPDGAAAVRAARRYRVPSIVMSGGSDLRLLPQKQRRRLAIMQVLDQADRLVVFSKELARHSYRLGMAPSNVDVVYRGVDRRCFRNADKEDSRSACGLPRDGVAIFWAGRFEDVKNPELLLHAAVRWNRHWGPRLRVILAGAGPLRNHLRRLSRKLQLDNVLVFAGNLTQRELALRYNAADLTVLTSRSEGIPNVLLETIACETPFVATDVGGVAEIASPGIDQLIPAGNVQALANTVIRQIENSPKGRRAFVPTDLCGMADQFDVVLGRAVDTASIPRPKTAPILNPSLLLPTIDLNFQEPAR